MYSRVSFYCIAGVPGKTLVHPGGSPSRTDSRNLSSLCLASKGTPAITVLVKERR